VPGAEDRRRAAGDLGRAHIGLLTGPIAVGKTTVAERAVGLARRRGLSYGGLLAPAMQTRCGPKTGIWAVDLTTGDRRILARTDRTLGGPLVGAYSFDQAALDWSLQVVERAIGNCDLLVVDEIGKLELWQGAGLAPVLPRLAAGEAARALVVVRASLLADLQSRLGTARQFVFEVDEDNRGSLPAAILDALFAPDKTEV
jgi:nucleoside-triphosphatase THEP1